MIIFPYQRSVIALSPSERLDYSHNWLADGNKKADIDDFYFKKLCNDSVYDMKRYKHVFVFEIEQIEFIKRKLNCVINVKVHEGKVYELWLTKPKRRRKKHGKIKK